MKPLKQKFTTAFKRYVVGQPSNLSGQSAPSPRTSA